MTKKVQEKNGRDDFQLRVTRSGSSQAFRRSAESCVNEIARNEFRGEKCAKSGFLKWGALRRCHVFPPTPYQVVARNHFSCALRACKKIRELYVPEIIFQVLSRGLFRAFWYLLRDELFTERFDSGPLFGIARSRSGIVWRWFRLSVFHGEWT